MAIQGEPVAHNDLVSGAQTALHSHAGGGGGFTPTYFQSTKSGDQSMSNGSFADITSWLSPTHTHADYSFSTSTGVLTINTTGDYEVTAHILADSGTNRTETGIRIMLNGGAITGCESRNYSSRNASQDEGSVCIPGFLVACNATDTLKVQGLYLGTQPVASARGTWFQVKKIG